MTNYGQLFGLATCVAIYSTTALANQELPVSDVPSNSTVDELFAEIPSVYSASKYAQKVTKAPASISIVTADEIKKWGYRSFGDVLSSLKGFYSVNDRSYGHTGARGIGTQSDYNTRLLLLIDGHRFNDALFEGFDTTGAFPVELDDIERIEVVRGPSSSLYGSSAFLGVINVITKRGRDQQGVSVKASYGSNDAYKTTLSVGDRFKNGLETFFSGTFYNSDGFNTLYFPEFDNPENNHGISVGLDGEQSKKLMAKAAIGDISMQAVYSKRTKDTPTAAYNTLFNYPINLVDNEYTFVELKYDHTFENQLNLQSRLSYNNTRYHSVMPYDSGESNVLLNYDLSSAQWVRAELEASKMLWEDHHLTVGGQFQQNIKQFQTNYDIATNLAVDAKTYQWALFLQDEYSITDNLTFNAGLRLDYYSIFGATVNPRLGLIYEPRENSMVKLLYGTAFRAPNQYEMNYYASSSVGNAFIAPDLKPETLDTVELIVEHYFTSQCRGELNLFHTQINDVIGLKEIDALTSQHRNMSDTESSGIELQLENSWGNGWQGRLSYTWQQSESQKNNRMLINSPEHMVKLNVIAPLWTDKVFLGFETQYMSSRFAKDFRHVRGQVPEYVVSNLTLFPENWIKGLQLSGGVYNLFDQRYYDPAPAGFPQTIIQQDALTFRIKASLDF